MTRSRLTRRQGRWSNSEMDTDLVAQTVANANRSEIARQTGISLSGVSRILSGKRTASANNLAVVAAKLGVPMGDLYIYLNGGRKRKRKQRVA